MLTSKRFDIILSRIEKTQEPVEKSSDVKRKERKVKEVKVGKPE